MLITERNIHERIVKMFPFLVCEGWGYKGFHARADQQSDFIHLRFEKSIKGRLAYAKVSIAAHTFNMPGYDLKAWMIETLRAKEQEMVDRWLAEFAGAA